MQNTLPLMKLPHNLHCTPKNTETFKKAALLILGIIAIAISAKIAIPLQPVPVTLQDFAVLFIGMTYGWRLGSATVMLYLTLGALGFPFFADTPLLAPNAGYLFAFVPAAALSGYLTENGWGRNSFTAALAGLAGLAVIFAGGLSVLAALMGWQKSLAVGFIPFILGDTLKLIFLSLVIPTFWKQQHKR